MFWIRDNVNCNFHINSERGREKVIPVRVLRLPISIFLMREHEHSQTFRASDQGTVGVYAAVSTHHRHFRTDATTDDVDKIAHQPDCRQDFRDELQWTIDA